MRVSDLPAYQSEYLNVADLQGKTAEVTIEEVVLEQVWNAGKRNDKLSLKFKGKKKRLILSKGRARAMVEIAGDEWTAWPGVVIRLAAGVASNGKNTIDIFPALAKAAGTENGEGG